MNAAARMLNQGTLSRGWIISLVISRSQYKLALIISLIVMTALSTVYVTNVTRRLNMHLQQNRVERDQLHLQWGQLLLEQSTLTTQARVQQIAENKLGMVVPSSQSVVIVTE